MLCVSLEPTNHGPKPSFCPINVKSVKIVHPGQERIEIICFRSIVCSGRYFKESFSGDVTFLWISMEAVFVDCGPVTACPRLLVRPGFTLLKSEGCGNNMLSCPNKNKKVQVKKTYQKVPINESAERVR